MHSSSLARGVRCPARGLVAAVLLAVLLPCDALPARPVISYETRNGNVGLVSGQRFTSAGAFGKTARDYAAFYGVPYAKAPVGELRFKPPERVPLPNGTWFATNENVPQCLQQRRPPDGVLGSEDCLTLHIITPNYDEPVLDVLVYIHGGAFMYGNSPRTGMQYLMDNDVVIVSVDYRLGILGFLSFEDETQPGNLGMLDQVEALRWIQENIGVFGGNNNSVTIIGNSAGSASCLMHTLSPASKGLFHKVIGMSGSPLNPWTRQYSARVNALRVAELTNCTASTTTAMVDCLRRVDGNELVALERAYFQGWKEHPFSPFAPVVDKKSRTPFLPDEPQQLVKNRRVSDVPMILSLTSNEGLYTAAEFITQPSQVVELDRQWEREAPGLLHFHDDRVTAGERADVARRVREHYMKNASLSNSLEELVQMMSDRNFDVGVAEYARMHAAVQTAPIYFYRFAYRGQYSLTTSESQGSMANLGVSHADDLQYPFELLGWSGVLTRPEDMQVRENLIDMWVSFAAHATPSVAGVTWRPVSRTNSGDLDTLLITGGTNMTMVTERNTGDESFWKSLPIKENGGSAWSFSPRPSASVPLLCASLAALGFLTLATN